MFGLVLKETSNSHGWWEQVLVTLTYTHHGWLYRHWCGCNISSMFKKQCMKIASLFLTFQQRVGWNCLIVLIKSPIRFHEIRIKSHEILWHLCEIPLNPTKWNKTHFLQVDISLAESAQPINQRKKPGVPGRAAWRLCPNMRSMPCRWKRSGTSGMGAQRSFNWMNYDYPHRCIHRSMKIVVLDLSLSISWIIMFLSRDGINIVY